MSPDQATTSVCCSFCGCAGDDGYTLIEAPDKSAYICGDCALKSTYLVFAHKQSLTHKLIAGFVPLAAFFLLGGTLGAYFLFEDLPHEPHISLGLFVLGFLAWQVIHFWWPDDDCLPRRPWF